VQDEVNQDYSEQNEVDGMKKGADRYGSPQWTMDNGQTSCDCNNCA